jgi:hypothetical protein
MSIQVELISEIAKLSLRAIGGPLSFLFGEERLSAREIQLKLLQDLTAAEIDPELFDLMLSSELDRNLKKQFGVAFFVATVAVTVASYAVIILNAVYKWGISDIAITALIVETPIQFIGLLYIIARNLFPQRLAGEPRVASTRRPPAAAPRPPQQAQESATPTRPRGRRVSPPQSQEAG